MNMMSLGLFGFSLSNAAYQDLKRKSSWRHPTTDRVGALPAGQFVGPGEDTITLSGVILAGLSGRPGSLDDLRRMADEGLAWPLVTGSGVVLGAFRIVALDESQQTFFQDGVARRYDFSLTLERADEAEGLAPAQSPEAAAPVQPSPAVDPLGALLGLF